MGFASPSQDYGDVEAPVGYQLYEWYRFYVVAEYIEGGFSDAVFCFDVRFVTQDDYTNSIGNDDDFSFPTTNGYDRRDFNGDELTTYHLTADEDSGRFRYQWGIELKNINWDFSFDGVKARDLFKKLSVYRAERIDEVLASGYLNMAVKLKIGTQEGIGISDDTFIDFPCSIKYSSKLTTGIDPAATSNTVPLQSVLYSYQDSVGISKRNYASFYSPDYLYSPSLFSFVIGDQIKVLGFCKSAYDELFYSGGPGPYTQDCALRVFKNDPNSSLSSCKSINIEESKYVSLNTNQFFNDEKDLYVKEGDFPLPQGVSAVRMFNSVPDTTDYNQFIYTSIIYGRETESPVMRFDSDLNPQRNSSDQAIDFGMYLGLHFRRRNNKYGERTSNVNILSTDYKVFNGESSKVVFGGDVYTQGSWLKKQYFDPSANPANNGGSASMLMVTQNRINTQLRTLNPDLPNRIYPQEISDWTVWAVFPLFIAEYYNYNSGYLEIKNQQLVPSFNPELITRTTFPTRIIYSELKPNSSVKDFYRLFPPGQFRDNPNNFGAITHMDIKQGELFTLQELCYTREFLNSTGQLATIDSGQVIIGDSSVLSRPGVRLTSLGSKHKWSYARGLTDAGTDVRCWVNSDFFVVLRAGRDGTVNLTERSMMDTFLRENMRFVRDKFTPADGQGIHAVWDDVGKNFVITVRGWKDNVEWGTLTRYFTGTVVRYKEKYGVPILYVALVNIVLQDELQIQPDQPEAEGLWQKIEFTNTNYYSVFTICFNEARNRFTHFNTFYPKIYATHFDRFFSPKPHEGESNKFYLMRQGEALVFYDEEHEGYTEYVINQEPSMLKKFVSIAYNAILKPLRVEFKTQFISEQGIEERVTSLDRSELKIRENIVYSTIKNTLDENGQNNQRTAPMKGMWLRIKTFFKAKENQKINDIFVPIRMGQRNVKNP